MAATMASGGAVKALGGGATGAGATAACAVVTSAARMLAHSDLGCPLYLLAMVNA
jgi:hypothetical protein